mgnify:CR=1 FL=1
MATLINIKTFSDERGNLSVLEDFDIPFDIKRIFFIYGVDRSVRGGHRHRQTRQALICIKGKCEIDNNTGEQQEMFILDNPKKCLIVEPEDWHTMKNFSDDTILLVLASENFDESDYIYEPY